MANKAAVVIAEDHFDMIEGRLSNGLLEEVRRTGHAVRDRTKQNIVSMGAVDTGHMLRSVDIEYGAGGESVDVSVNTDYASFVHDGTEHMAPRPFLAQAVADQARETEQRLDRIIERDYE